MLSFRLIYAVLTVLTVAACSLQKPAAVPTKSSLTPLDRDDARAAPAKKLNVILMIGDGMGLTQITAGMYANGNEIAFERMPVVGLHKSYSSDNLVTDSAAGATAFSCGEKTYNGAVGVRPDRSPCPTLLELAERQGRPTGLVATSTIVHATPAAFYAHVPQRKQYERIAEHLAGSGVDYFIGGGQKFFADRKRDKRDLLDEMRAGGRQLGSYFDGPFADQQLPLIGAYGYFSALEDPLPVSGGRDYLLEATTAGLDFLTARDSTAVGVFMMVEGSQIDWGGHANNSAYIISEVIEFSETVNAVLDFAEADGNTLVVVTADHETGGYAINNGSTPDSIVGEFTSDYHTADLIPVFAYGPGAEAFAGIYENTAIYDKLRAAMTARP